MTRPKPALNPEDELLTTAEAAVLAGVGTTSVKRWADLELLPCVRTAGGHRRFRRADLEQFLRAQGPGPASESARARWSEAILQSDPYEILGELFHARQRLGSFARVADELGEGLAEVGSAWERGEITVLEEHAASEKLERAIHRIVESILLGNDARQCLLAMAPGDEHTLGLSLVELCLREAGWGALWTGRNTPVEDIVEIVSAGRVQMVALSASVVAQDEVGLKRQADAVGKACKLSGVPLVLGGTGAWPDSPTYGTRFRSLVAFRELLRNE